MNGDQFGGIVRAILTAAGGYLVGRGIVDSGTATAVTGGVVTVAGALWSFYTNRPGVVIPPKAP